MAEPEETFAPRTAEELKAQKRRNRWLALALVVFLVLVFFATVSRVRQGIYWRMPDQENDVVSREDPDFVRAPAPDEISPSDTASDDTATETGDE